MTQAANFFLEPIRSVGASLPAPRIFKPGKPVAFYIRKPANGVTVWLKRMGPAIIWGPKDQALQFTSVGVARMTLQRIPKADRAEIETEESETPKP